ncbi:glycosyltransferase family 4 protein [Tropicimonas sp. TH_r6]|uniref:glycosyltransferase family 4 protein n=1 Tax=Tropicimonas sp. TH_r6 TaxID=3082085 RepID=UPI002955A8F1|nr:glycosyltransferase family 4 protein [Tropicimonas sp. TH_r6]MDV7144007.1 glycosyltransferase family 4 protein [Tropicimonas sp. TH_r6]
MPLKTIVHLVDDTNAGGVTRMLDHIRTAPGMAEIGHHKLQVVKRGRFSAPDISGDIIISHLSVSWRTLPMLMALRARYAGLPLIHFEHSYTEAFTATRVPRQKRFMTLLRTAYSLFDHVVAVSEAQGRWMRQRKLVRADALRVIPSCVDLAPFLTLEPVYSQPRTIGAIGRFDTQKGFDILIKAFRATSNPDLRLRLIGDGVDRTELEALAAGDTRISFAGYQKDPVAAMATLDVVAMPSRWEAYGLVALEARAAGRPLLVSPVDGLKDHADQGARVVSGGTLESWREALEQLASAGPALHIETARARAAARASMYAVHASWKDLLSPREATTGGAPILAA